MAKKLSKETLVKIMLYQLEAFNDENEKLSENTIHNKVLSDSDGFGAASSKNIYKAAIRWTLAKANLPDKTWPSSWMEMTVNDLAENLLKKSE